MLHKMFVFDLLKVIKEWKNNFSLGKKLESLRKLKNDRMKDQFMINKSLIF